MFTHQFKKYTVCLNEIDYRVCFHEIHCKSVVFITSTFSGHGLALGVSRTAFARTHTHTHANWIIYIIVVLQPGRIAITIYKLDRCVHPRRCSPGALLSDRNFFSKGLTIEIFDRFQNTPISEPSKTRSGVWHYRPVPPPVSHVSRRRLVPITK